MPCSCEGYEEAENAELRDLVDRLTQDLCYLCSELAAARQLTNFGNKRIAAWWKNHQRDDKKRVTEKMKEHVHKQHTDALDAAEMAQHFIALAEEEHPVSDAHMVWFNRLAADVVDAEKKKRAKAKKKKALKKQALAKLSPEEREALGE